MVNHHRPKPPAGMRGLEVQETLAVQTAVSDLGTIANLAANARIEAPKNFVDAGLGWKEWRDGVQAFIAEGFDPAAQLPPQWRSDLPPPPPPEGSPGTESRVEVLCALLRSRILEVELILGDATTETKVFEQLARDAAAAAAAKAAAKAAAAEDGDGDGDGGQQGEGDDGAEAMDADANDGDGADGRVSRSRTFKASRFLF